MDDLIKELERKTKQLDVSIKELRKNGTAFAAAEREYKIILRTECLKLKQDGMTAGMIEKTCYGIQVVADARYKRDLAEVVYQANIEAINAIKLQMRLIESQINREWNS